MLFQLVGNGVPPYGCDLYPNYRNAVKKEPASLKRAWRELFAGDTAKEHGREQDEPE